jgi:alkylation response protein AidB-like acyl-CoA dehydrogenase
MLDEALWAEQRDLRREIAKMLRKTVPPFTDRHGSAARSSASHNLWRRLCDMGVHGIGIDSEAGGVGGGLFELAVVSRELGRVLAPVSLVYGSGLAAGLGPALGEAGRCLLRALTSGARVTTVIDTRPESETRVLTIIGKSDSTSCTVSGELAGVHDADLADLLLTVTAPSFGDAPTLLIIDIRTEGIERSRTSSRAVMRTVSDLTLHSVPARQLTLGREHVQVAVAKARVLLAYEMLGAAEATVALAADYVRTRKQFGQPLGAFQAVAHRLAAVFTELQGAAAAASFATRSNATPQFEVLAASARERAARALRTAGEDSIQVVGAIGYSAEFPLHHYIKYALLAERELAELRPSEMIT